MNDHEAATLILYVAAKWPKAGKASSDPREADAQIQVWLDHLGEFDGAMVRAVLTGFGGAFPPNVTEIRSRRSEQGDLTQNFDPDDFSRTGRTAIDQDTARLGLRYSPTPRVDLLASLIASERDTSELQTNDFFNFTDDI